MRRRTSFVSALREWQPCCAKRCALDVTLDAMRALLNKSTQSMQAAAVAATSPAPPRHEEAGTSPGDVDRLERRRQRGVDTVFVAPPHWGDDEKLFRSYGIRAYLNPNGVPFTGLFRQRWEDFCVTEMPLWGELLSREADYTIPPPPSMFRDVETERAAVASLKALEVSTETKPEETEAALALAQDLYEAASPHVMSNKVWYVEFVMRKQHLSHNDAMQLLSKALRVHPRDISVAGIKDFVGDTIQRVRVKMVSAGTVHQVTTAIDKTMAARRQAISYRSAGNDQYVSGDTEAPDFASNLRWRRNRAKQQAATGGSSYSSRARPLPSDATIRLSNFSYHDEPLRPGYLAGNHFRIVLRDLNADEATVTAAAKSIALRGCPNYFGSQRFSWFSGYDDESYALLQRDWVRYFFSVLDFCKSGHTARELLQRRRVYPLPYQNSFRRLLVKRLRSQSDLTPHMLDDMTFSECPERGENLDTEDLSKQEQQFITAVHSTFTKLSEGTRPLANVRFVSFLWNLALSARIAKFGDRVLLGDWVIPQGKREVFLNAPPVVQQKRIRKVTPANIGDYTIFDVVHPAFAFGNSPLPENAVRDIYLSICAKYNLSWSTQYGRWGINDFVIGPRPIALKVDGVRCDMNADDKTCTLEFMLPRGSYATVVLREFMHAENCLNAPVATYGKMPDSMWDMGAEEPSYVPTLDDFYVETCFDSGVDNDQALPEDKVDPTWELAKEHQATRRDVAHDIARFTKHNFQKALVRKEQEQTEMLRRLVDDRLLEQMTTEERLRYAGHTVPRRANANAKTSQWRARVRTQRLGGRMPRQKARFDKSAFNVPSKRKQSRHQLVTKDTWNIY
jgi:TruD family tRNA pseudouridine synthase